MIRPPDDVADEVPAELSRAPARSGWLTRLLVLILVLASLLRIVLVVHGGQAYWPDEQMYAAVFGHWDRSGWDILRAIMATGDHLGFAVVAALPAGVHHALSGWTGLASDRLLLWPGVFFSQMSVLAIALVYAIARRTGAERVEALTAAVLTACATSMFYYSRHLLPYDTAMVFALAGLWCGMGPSPGRRASAACGALAACAFITYNGYWLLAGVVMSLPAIMVLPEWRDALRRAALAGLGFAAIVIIVIACQTALGVPPMFAGMARLAGTVRDGYLPEGFLLSWAYLWHAEHGLLLLWLASATALVVSDAPWPRRRRHATLLWLGSAAGIYLGLAVSSTILRVFVVMGRQSRQMVPLLCLAAAPVLVSLFRRCRYARLALTLGIAALAVQTAYNFREPLLQQFPREFEAQVDGAYTPRDYGLSIAGPTPRGEPAGARWMLLNVQHLHPPRATAVVPAGRTVFHASHPLSFLPYQYEGFTPIQREVLRTNDITMRLIDTGTR
jgi:hypothetical protein